MFSLTSLCQGDWSSVYAPGAEILSHMREIVEKYQLESHIKLGHELMHAWWDEGSGKWRLRLERVATSAGDHFEEVEDEADFLFMAVGTLSRWRWPDIKGLHDFKGTLLHSANWNLGGETWEEDVKDWGDKNVAVIGLVSARPWNFRSTHAQLVRRDPRHCKSFQLYNRK